VPLADLDFSDYFEGLGSLPVDLVTTGFLQRFAFADPGNSLGVNVLRTNQPPKKDATTLALLLDVDAYTTEPFKVEESMISKQLERLRTLKNRMFFMSLTKKALDRCR